MAPHETTLGQARIFFTWLKNLQTIIFEIVIQHALAHSFGLDLAARNIFFKVGLRGASRFGPNGLKIQKETTPGIVRWTRVPATK